MARQPKQRREPKRKVCPRCGATWDKHRIVQQSDTRLREWVCPIYSPANEISDRWEPR